MAVCTTNNAFFNLKFCLRNTLAIADIKFFGAFNMVKMECFCIGFITTVHASIRNLKIINPFSDRICPIIGNLIHMTTINRILEIPFNISAVIFSGFYRIFEWHRVYYIMYPCKPDIFEMTYEEVRE